MRLSALFLIPIFPLTLCVAQETVYLNSGFSLTVDSHSEMDGVCILRLGSGTIEYPASQISQIVTIPNVPAPEEHSVPAAQKPETILNQAAQNEGVNAIFMRAVAKVESGLRQEAVSKKGALGLMQLMPGTAAELGVDPKQADQNALGGAKYLRALLERYHYNPILTLAAYNAGPEAVNKFGGLPPYYETRTYVIRVLREYERQLKLAGLQADGTPAAKTQQTANNNASRTPSATN